jgi:PAS domain S-box-containing protein
MKLPLKNSTIIVIISLLIIIVSITVMVGWLFNLPALQFLFITEIAMKFNTALCFIVFAGALLISQNNNSNTGDWLYFSLVFVGTLIGGVTLCQDLFGFNCGIDNFFVKDHSPITELLPYPGRMATNSSFNFFALGVGLLMIRTGKKLKATIAQYAFHLVTILSAISLIGFLYGVSIFHTLFYISAMPPNTAILFFALSLVASLYNPTIGISQVFTGELVGNQMARRLFFSITLAIIFLAIVRRETRDLHLFSSMDIGVSLLAICFLIMSLLLVWNTTIWLNRIDMKRYEAEEKVRIMNASLEKLVEERSAELREAELKFRTIAEKSMVGVYIIQNELLSYVNPRFASIFGFEPDEMVNVSVIDKIFNPREAAVVAENIRRRLEGELDSMHYEILGRKKNGQPTWIEIYGNAVTIAGKPAIIGSMIDVTERKKAEEELKASEQKYKLLFDSNPMPMWMIDKDNLKVIAANEAAAKHYGYLKNDLIGMDMRLFRLVEDSQEQMEEYTRELDGEMRVVRHLKKDGSIIFVQIIAHDIIIEGKHVRLALTNDVTEKLKAEESLQKSEANLQAILRTTDTAYALFDRQMNILASNQKATEFIKEQYGYDTSRNKSLSDFLSQERFPELSNLVNEVLKGKNLNFEIDFNHRDGSVTWYYVRLFPITNEHKAILGILMALYDITERKNAEQDLKAAYEDIQSHINSIKDMAWKQSHLIRSPLANLKGLTALLQDDETDNEVLEYIQNELNRMDSIIIEMAEDVSEQYKNES